jgi:hypothetical protein
MPCAGCPSCDALPSFIGRLIPKEEEEEKIEERRPHVVKRRKEK